MHGTTFADEIRPMMRYKSSVAVKQIVDVKERNNESSVNRGCNLKVCGFIESGWYRLKILSKKKYNKLIEDFEESQKKVEELKRINESIEKKLEDNKTSCRLNKGSQFCFDCKNSYRYRTYMGIGEVEQCGCLLDVSCESFERKEDN